MPEYDVIVIGAGTAAMAAAMAAIARAEAYAEAGADVVFVEAPESVAQIEEIARRLPMPKLINMSASRWWIRPGTLPSTAATGPM